MNYKPLRTNILVLRDNPEEKTSGGLIIHEQLKQVKNIGVVVDIGDQVVDIQKGDKVVFNFHNNHELKIDCVDHLIMDQKNVYAVINEG